MGLQFIITVISMSMCVWGCLSARMSHVPLCMSPVAVTGIFCGDVAIC